MSLIQITEDIARAPAGNPLRRRPAEISGGSWRRITVAWIQSGQSRRYGDSIYEAEICFEGGARSTIKDFDLGFGTKPSEEKVKEVARLLVRPFEDAPGPFGGRLESISLTEKGETFSIWKVRIVEPYTD